MGTVDRLIPSDVTRALELWRKFARQNGLDLGDPDRAVFMASYLNQFMDEREAEAAEVERTLQAALARKRARQ